MQMPGDLKRPSRRGGGDLQRSRERVAAARALTPQGPAVPERFAKRIEEAERKRAEAEAAARQAELEQQKIDAQLRRDRLQHQYDLESTGQRGMIAANAQADDFGYTSQLAKQQQAGQQKRDRALAGYDSERAKEQFGYQTERDATQQQYTRQNATQRQMFEVSERWNSQVQQARAAGLEFSEKQKADMDAMDEAFRKNVLNNPALDEGLRLQAGLAHQQKLAAIIPNTKVVTAQDKFNGSIVVDEQSGTRYMVERGAGGQERFIPLGPNGALGEKAAVAEQAAIEKKQADVRKKTLDRAHAFQKVYNEVVNERDPETEEKLYKTEAEVQAAVMERFAADEAYYEGEGVPRHPMYNQGPQIPAGGLDAARRDALGARQQIPQAMAPQQPMVQGQMGPQGQPTATQLYEQDPAPAMPKPQQVSSTDIDSLMEREATGGDPQKAAALAIVKTLGQKYNGMIPPGTEEYAAFHAALKFLRDNNVQIQTSKKAKMPYDAKYVFPGP